MRSVPPTLPAPSARALVRGLVAMARPSAHVGEIERQLAATFPAAATVTYGTGRAALASAIAVAMKATGRRTVVLPAYTSYSVAAAAAAAGARVRLCDVSASTLDFDLRDLRSCVGEDTAAVVFGNLFGLPSADREFEWIRGYGALVIDDAAQALGGRGEAGPVGWRGDLGVLSFGRGKCVTTGDGGVLLAHREELRGLAAELPRPRPRRGLGEWLSAVAVRACATPILFEVIRRLPGARIGETHYDPVVEMAPVTAAAQGLAADLELAIGLQLQARTDVARMWLRALAESPLVEAVAPRAGTTPAFLRLPVLSRDRSARRLIGRHLAAQGFRYVGSYPTSLSGVAEFHARHCEARPTPEADRIAETLIALPCHGGVRPLEVRRAAAVLCGEAERSWRLEGGVVGAADPAGTLSGSVR